MKVLLLLFLIVNIAYAKEDRSSKIYTKKQFEDELNKRIKESLSKLKNGKIIDFSQLLLNRERELKIREFQVKKSEEQLKINEKELKKKVEQFNKKQKDMIACIDNFNSKKSQRIAHIVKTISGMRPENAAAVLSVQDTDISIKILGQLEPDKVSKIFNFMDKEISARLQKQYVNMSK